MPPARRRPKRSTEHRRVRLYAHKDGTYDRLLAEQGGTCAICPAVPKTRRLHIDHDHRTMEIRGVLCFRCNAILRVWITAHWLRRAADYLDGLLPGGRNYAERKRPPKNELDEGDPLGK